MATNDSPSVWSAPPPSHPSQPSTTTTSSIESASSQLIGEDHDAFIPTPAQVCQIFHDGIKTWSLFSRQAEAIPIGLWPVNILDPYMTLFDLPCLPAKLPDSMFLHGRARWHLPRPDCDETTTESGDWDPSLLHGPRVAFILGNDEPIRCGVCPDAATMPLASSPEMAHGHAVLTMCWSYILSVRFLEMQGRQIRYSEHRIWPKAKSDGPAIYLDGASPALIRWLCGILSSNLGWSADGNFFPPWAACLTINPELVTTSPTFLDDLEAPLGAPGSSEATSLLLELCQLFGLDTEVSEAGWTALPPCRAAFLAALMLPLYRFTGLTPQFPHPKMSPVNNRNPSNVNKPGVYLQYLHDIRYFMTLSMHPPSLGSIMWSALWQPDVDCNLVSPWLASFIHTRDQITSKRQLEILVKMLALRRPRAGIWWLALFLLGDPSTIHWFQRYTETLAEKRASASLSAPDPMVSAWSGLKQSFLDYGKTKQYKGPSDLVSREDLLRCRFVFHMQDRYFSSLSWRPFGHMDMHNVEPELWPYLENDYNCVYDSFAWYRDGKLLHASRGFRAETGRHVKQVPDDLERRRSETSCLTTCQHTVKLDPSKICTLKMLSLLVYDATGGHHWANVGLPSTNRRHRWLRDWQGLDCVDDYDDDYVDLKPDTHADAKPPSWFLLDWIRHQASRRANVKQDAKRQEITRDSSNVAK